MNTPTLTISATGSLVTIESQDIRFNVPSERQHLTQGSVPNHCPGALGYFLDQRKECLLLALQHHFQQHLVSQPEDTIVSPWLGDFFNEPRRSF